MVNMDEEMMIRQVENWWQNAKAEKSWKAPDFEHLSKRMSWFWQESRSSRNATHERAVETLFKAAREIREARDPIAPSPVSWQMSNY